MTYCHGVYLIKVVHSTQWIKWCGEVFLTRSLIADNTNAINLVSFPHIRLISHTCSALNLSHFAGTSLRTSESQFSTVCYFSPKIKNIFVTSTNSQLHRYLTNWRNFIVRQQFAVLFEQSTFSLQFGSNTFFWNLFLQSCGSHFHFSFSTRRTTDNRKFINN